MPKLALNRQQLKSFLPDHQAIVAFEKVLGDIGTTMPDTIEEVAALAASAAAVANSALGMLADLAAALDQLQLAAASNVPDLDDFTPPLTPPTIGTLGEQDANNVAITGGTINGTAIGATSPNTGAFTTLNASGAVVLSPANANVVLAPTGTGLVTINPAAVGSANNINIGAATPATGAFTTLSASAATVTTLTASSQVIGTRTYTVAPALRATTTSATLGSTIAATNSNTSQFLVGYSGSTVDPSSAIWWTAGTALRFATATDALAGGFVQRASIDANGLRVVAGFGCNGKTAQGSVASGGAMDTAGATNTAPYGFTTAAQADSIAAKLNAIQAALIANGIMS